MQHGAAVRWIASIESALTSLIVILLPLLLLLPRQTGGYVIPDTREPWQPRNPHYPSEAEAQDYNDRFWEPFLTREDGLRHRGVHYTVDGDLDSRSGYPPGTRWTFVMYDGRVIRSTNVSCQGAIPQRFQMFMLDNVKWMSCEMGSYDATNAAT